MIYKHNNLYEALSEVVDANPNLVAVFDGNKKISYNKLKHSVDILAGYFQSIGLKIGDKVAMCITNSYEFVVSYYAVTAIGAICVPMNTFLKSEEISYILKDCKAKVLITSPSLSKEILAVEDLEKMQKIIWLYQMPKHLQEENNSQIEIDESVGESMYLDQGFQNIEPKNILFEDIMKNEYKFDLKISPKIDDLVHIIYTSGTTGKPKGAMISYKNIFSNIYGTYERFEVKKSDRFIVFLPMFHSFTLTAMIILPITYGASMILIKSVFPFSNVLKQALLKRATIFLGVPAIYTAIGKAKIPWYFRWFNKIRLFICGAAPLAKQTIDDFKIKFPRAKLIEGYGLSECSPIVAANLFEKQKPLSVGVALGDYEVKIVDDEMIQMPTNEIGEIIVKGDCVMQGYLGVNNDDNTIINGWLRTGDLGYIDEDNFIYIVDRKKDLIISKGINIYPREIEEIISKLEEVEATAVIGVKDRYADEEVVAFIQFKENMSLEKSEIISYLRSRLANFKVPKSIYFAEKLPTNATGKVLKRKLKEQMKDKI